jgi:hypothetical protein
MVSGDVKYFSLTLDLEDGNWFASLTNWFASLTKYAPFGH